MGDISTMSVKSNMIMDSPATKSTTSIKSEGGEKPEKDPARYEQLKLRKAELEKKLNEKYAQLQQVIREEAHLIGMYPNDTDQNGNAPTLRRKIGTSFKLPENLLNNKEDDINKLLLEKQVQQQITEASLRLSNDTSQSKSVRRTHKQNYEAAQQKLLAINQNLSMLKKRQQLTSPPKAAVTTKDDIDLHKTANFNRMRSNSNSSGMVMSPKSTTSSNQSIHQMAQTSPYTINNNVMPSGSQTMTPASSAAMVSQLSMLKQRTRHESFSNYINYDINSNENVKLSPMHNHGHHHYKQSPVSRHSVNYRNSSYSPTQSTHQQYVSSPPVAAQHFVYDPKVISRLNDQNYNPNTGYDVTDRVNHNVHHHYHNHNQQYHSPTHSHSSHTSGLGGYWMTLDNNEKVWCPVENPRFNKPHNPQVKLQRNVTSVSQYGKNNNHHHPHKPPAMLHQNPTKSTSLGNFDMINKYDDTVSIGQASIVTTLSGGEARKREKVWRETSLDGPPVNHNKSSTSVSPSPSAMSITNSNYQHHQPIHHSQMLHINTNFDALSYNASISPDLPSPPPLPPQPVFHQQQQMSRNSMRYNTDRYSNMTHSSSYYDDDDLPPPPPAMLESPRVAASEPLVSPSISISSALLSPSTVLVKSADIQTESPKNVTVVQQGKILPYKEVSKPFEMSDFYKYSTKFRQKQQLQPGGSESPIYHPPNPSIYQSVINN